MPTRAQQRFENLKNAAEALGRAVTIENPSETERGGLIQFFEVAFELSWKTLKDLMEEKGTLIPAPRDVLKQAFQDGLIEDGHVWLKALEKRNLTTHIYDQILAKTMEDQIKKEFNPAIQALVTHLKTLL